MRAGRADAKQQRPATTNRSVAPAPVRAGRSDASQQRPVIADRSDRVKGGDSNRGQAKPREQGRSYDKGRSEGRSNHDRGGQSYNGSRGGNHDRGGNKQPSYGGNHAKRMPYYAHGRVSKVHHYGNGYRVWVHGAPYPFFVPTAYYHRGHFGIGMTIRVGGYYNPRGYYDYYGDYASNAIAGRQLRGIVESIDHYRGLFVVNLAGQDGYVTVRIPDRYERIWEGAYVVIYGDWGREGLFLARDVDVIDDRYRW